MKLQETQQAIDDWFNSEECERYFIRAKEKQEVRVSQIERFNNANNFTEFTEKVIAKYSSDKYRNRWYSRNIEPPEDLIWFLFEYAEKYGRECTEQECEKYENIFTSDLIFCNGYYFHKMNGQGSVIYVIKE